MLEVRDLQVAYGAAPALRVIAMTLAEAGKTASTTASNNQRNGPSMNGVVASMNKSSANSAE